MGTLLETRRAHEGARRVGESGSDRPAGRRSRHVGGDGRLLKPPPVRGDLVSSRDGVWFACGGFAAGVIIAALTTALAEFIGGYKFASTLPVPLGVSAADLVGLWAGLVGAAVAYSRSKGTGHVASDYGLATLRWWDLPAGVAIGLACQYGLVPVVYYPLEAIDRHLAHQLSAPARTYTGAVHSFGGVAVLLLLLAVAGPIVEELFFRGLLLRSLGAWFPTPIAISVSAVLFGLAHFEAVQFVGLAAFGVVLGVLAWTTKRLAPSISAHASFNAAAVLAVVHAR